MVAINKCRTQKIEKMHLPLSPPPLRSKVEIKDLPPKANSQQSIGYDFPQDACVRNLEFPDGHISVFLDASH